MSLALTTTHENRYFRRRVSHPFVRLHFLSSLQDVEC
jgi:hypothetical protein